jgi:hypothetical protein
LLENGNEVLPIVRLEKACGCAKFAGDFLGMEIINGGEKHDGRGRNLRRMPDLVEEVKAVHIGHAQVADDEIGPEFYKNRERLSGAVGFFYLLALFA